MKYFVDNTPAIWLPQRAFEHLDRFSARLLLAVPPWLFLLKIWDRSLSNPGHPWSWYLAAGFFGKLDDLSLWIIIAGFIAARNVLKAWSTLPPLPDGHSEAVTSGDLRRTIFVTVGACIIYTAVMYPTNGTFFKPVPKAQRPAQIAEGLTNLGLAAVFYIYLVVGVMTVRRAARLKDEPSSTLDCIRLMQCTRLLVNAPYAFAVAVAAGAFFFPAIQWGGKLVFEHTQKPWWNWTLFQPDPLNEVFGGMIGAVFLVAIYFSPWFWLARAGAKLLCPGYRLRPNWWLLVLVIGTQGGIPSLLILMIRETTEAKGDFLYAVRVSVPTIVA